MGATINTRIQSKHDTTARWNRATGFVPKAGEIIIYDDYETETYTVEEHGRTVEKTVAIPNMKIGTGNAYVQDLPFVDENTRRMLLAHIDNDDIHVTLQEKQFWNNKLNIDDVYAQINHKLQDETLVFNRF